MSNADKKSSRLDCSFNWVTKICSQMTQAPSSHWGDIRMQKFRYFTTMDVNRKMQGVKSDQDKERHLNVESGRSINS